MTGTTAGPWTRDLATRFDRDLPHLFRPSLAFNLLLDRPAPIDGGLAVQASRPDAPVLFVVSGGQNRIVNYRMKNDMMIVDYNIDKAVLVSGVGWRQQKITIRRGG